MIFNVHYMYYSLFYEYDDLHFFFEINTVFHSSREIPNEFGVENTYKQADYMSQCAPLQVNELCSNDVICDDIHMDELRIEILYLMKL